MNLNRDTLKALIAEAIDELADPAAAAKQNPLAQKEAPPEADGAPKKKEAIPGKEPAAPFDVEQLSALERSIYDDLKKMADGPLKALKAKIENNSKTTDQKARMVLILAGVFGVQAADAKAGLQGQSDKLSGI